MKRTIIILMGLVSAITCIAQGWQYSQEFNTDVWTGYSDLSKDYVDCSGKSMNAMDAYVCTKKYGIDAIRHKNVTSSYSGLYDKVAKRTIATRPKRSTGSASKGKVGSYNYQTSDAHQQWIADRNRSIQEANEREKERKRQEKYMDDMVSAQVEAQANAMLQGETNRRIQNDVWNASEGAALAQRRVQNSIRIQGPRVTGNQNKLTAKQYAGLLKRQNKPRRFMLQNSPRNHERSTLASVRRGTVVTKQQRDNLHRALLAKTRITQKKRNTGNGYMIKVGGAKFFLSENATSTLGQDWTSDDFKPVPMPPAPATSTGGSQLRKMTQTEYHDLIMREMIDQRPLTPAEVKYYQNLTL